MVGFSCFKLGFGGCFIITCLGTIAFISPNIFLPYSFRLITPIICMLDFLKYFSTGHWIFVHFFPHSVSIWLICIALYLLTEIIGVLCLITLSFLVLCPIKSGHLRSLHSKLSPVQLIKTVHVLPWFPSLCCGLESVSRAQW